MELIQLAYNKALNGGGGGGITKTLLWENPSPTATFPQTGISITGATMREYNAIEYVTRSSTTSATETHHIFSSTVPTTGGLCNGSYARTLTFGTKLTIKACYEVGKTTIDNDRLIPVAIYGIKGNI